MQVYTFYPCRRDGSSIAFDVAHLTDDAAAHDYAARVLTRHDSAVEVVIWSGETRLGRVVREPAE